MSEGKKKPKILETEQTNSKTKNRGGERRLPTEIIQTSEKRQRVAVKTERSDYGW